MPGKTYAEKINSSTVMISGFKKNPERVAKRGIGSDFVPNLQTVVGEIIELNNEQESVKARLKTITEQLDAKVEVMDKMTAEGKKVVKLEFDKSQWKEFGLDDKR
jgi:hypothetical protein